MIPSILVELCWGFFNVVVDVTVFVIIVPPVKRAIKKKYNYMAVALMVAMLAVLLVMIDAMVVVTRPW